MKKLTVVLAIALLCNNMKAQTNNSGATGIGIGGLAFGAGFITGYFVANQKSKSNYQGPIDATIRKRIMIDNSPWLITGAGCCVIGVVSLIEGSNINLRIGKKKNTTVGIMGSGIGFSYAIR